MSALSHNASAAGNGPRNGISTRRRLIGVIVVMFLFAIVAAFFAGQLHTFQISSGSMEPSLQVGDFLLVDGRQPVSPRRGDVVALSNPLRPNEQLLCKRVVAEPFDEVEFIDGYFYLNGEWQNMESYVENSRIGGLPHQKHKLKVDEYFVLGDNRHNSFDSLDFGPVPEASLVGIVTWRYWPLNRIQKITNPWGE